MLNCDEIKYLIKEKGLIRDYINLDLQLTPNGFDLSVSSIYSFEQSGALDFSNKERVVPGGKEITPKKKKKEDKFGWWYLKPGAYKIRTNESVNLPNDLVGLAFTRTSVLRMGAFTQHGVWDAGFKGRGEFILVVENKNGLALKQNARIAQITFFKITQTKKAYQGIYQNL